MDYGQLSIYIMIPISTTAIMLGTIAISLIDYNIDKIIPLNAVWYELQIISIFLIIAIILTIHTYLIIEARKGWSLK
jgi:hypothetical protein